MKHKIRILNFSSCDVAQHRRHAVKQRTLHSERTRLVLAGWPSSI